MAKATDQHDKKSQLDKFKEAALELETDESEIAFDRALMRVAKVESAKDTKGGRLTRAPK